MATARGGTYSENPEMDGHECEPIHKDHLDLGYVCFEPDSEDEYLEEGPCAGEYNEFTQDRFKTSEKIVVLEINGHSFCHPYDSLMEFWENVDQQAVEWVKKAGVAEVEPDGHGSEPRLNSPIWFKHIQTGMWIPAYVRRYLLDNPPAPGVATAIRLERDGIMLIGNRYGTFGMSQIHGHPPGEPILRAIGLEGVVLQDDDIHSENLRFELDEEQLAQFYREMLGSLPPPAPTPEQRVHPSDENTISVGDDPYFSEPQNIRMAMFDVQKAIPWLRKFTTESMVAMMIEAYDAAGLQLPDGGTYHTRVDNYGTTPEYVVWDSRNVDNLRSDTSLHSPNIDTIVFLVDSEDLQSTNSGRNFDLFIHIYTNDGIDVKVHELEPPDLVEAVAKLVLRDEGASAYYAAMANWRRF